MKKQGHHEDVRSAFAEYAGDPGKRNFKPMPRARTPQYGIELVKSLRAALGAAAADGPDWGDDDRWFAVSAALSALYDFIAEADRYNASVSESEGDALYLVPRTPLRTPNLRRDRYGRPIPRERVAEELRRSVMCEIASRGGEYEYVLAESRPLGVSSDEVHAAAVELEAAGCIRKSRRPFPDGEGGTGWRVWLRPAWLDAPRDDAGDGA